MNTQVLAIRPSRSAIAAALLLFAALPASAPRALMDSSIAQAARHETQRALTQALADQGNRALLAIREDARAAAQRLPLPALPDYVADGAPGGTLARMAR